MVMLIFALCARDNPAKKVAASRADYANLLRESDTYWMCFFYSLTFGGFVGLTSYLTLYLPINIISRTFEQVTSQPSLWSRAVFFGQ